MILSAAFVVPVLFCMVRLYRVTLGAVMVSMLLVVDEPSMMVFCLFSPLMVRGLLMRMFS